MVVQLAPDRLNPDVVVMVIVLLVIYWKMFFNAYGGD